MPRCLQDDKVTLQRICKVLVADSAFSKRPFIDKVMKMGFHVVSRLRHDAALFYTWDGEPTGKPGRPRLKGDKIDMRNIDMSKVEMLGLEETSGKAYALKAWCKSLRRVVSLVIHELPNGVRRLYFSTDENMSGRDVVEYYTTRFQKEFCFRDAKQFLGLTDCQARDKRENLTLPSTLHSQHSMCPKSCARNLARPSVDLKRRWSMPTMRNELLTCSRKTRTRL